MHPKYCTFSYCGYVLSICCELRVSYLLVEHLDIELCICAASLLFFFFESMQTVCLFLFILDTANDSMASQVTDSHLINSPICQFAVSRARFILFA